MNEVPPQIINSEVLFQTVVTGRIPRLEKESEISCRGHIERVTIVGTHQKLPDTCCLEACVFPKAAFFLWQKLPSSSLPLSWPTAWYLAITLIGLLIIEICLSCCCTNDPLSSQVSRLVSTANTSMQEALCWKGLKAGLTGMGGGLMDSPWLTNLSSSPGFTTILCFGHVTSLSLHCFLPEK